MQLVGITYTNFIDLKTLEQTSIASSGTEVLACPYTGLDVQSTVCLYDAVKKLEKQVNDGIEWNEPDFIKLDNSYQGLSFHKTKFDLMCELKNTWTYIKDIDLKLILLN